MTYRWHAYGSDQFKEAIADAAKSRGKVLFTPKA
jgi:hypothetical protein